MKRACGGSHEFWLRLGFVSSSRRHNFQTLRPFWLVKYDRRMLRTIILLLALAASAFGENSAKDEAQVWELEKAYWEYVKANDLEKYRALWHENFVGWPFVSPAPYEGSHHRLDHFEHVKRDQAPVVSMSSFPFR